MTSVQAQGRQSVRAALLGCCASPAWADAVAEDWPYPDLATLLGTGERLWWGLLPADWREALSAHPRIGDRPQAGTQEQREQAAAEAAAPELLAAIAEGNRDYESRFAMTYVVRASGRSAQEMLDLLRSRLASEPEAELAVAAAQQWEITSLRLTALWRSLGPGAS